MNDDAWSHYDERAAVLRDMEDGWHWNDGEKMNPESMADLRLMVQKIEALAPSMPDMFPIPGLEGEIMASWSGNGLDGSIIVHKDRTVEAFMINPHLYVDVDGKTLEETVEVVAGWLNNPEDINWERD